MTCRRRFAHSLLTVRTTGLLHWLPYFCIPCTMQIVKKVSGWHQFAWFARDFAGGKTDDWPLQRTFYRAANYTFWPKSQKWKWKRENFMTREKNIFITVMKITIRFWHALSHSLLIQKWIESLVIFKLMMWWCQREIYYS